MADFLGGFDPGSGMSDISFDDSGVSANSGGFSLSNLSNIGGDLFGAAGSLLGGFGAQKADEISAQGFQAAAEEFGLGAAYARANASLSQQSTALQQYSALRTANLTNAATKAAIAGAGLAETGNAVDLMRENTMQFGLTAGMLGLQGNINYNSYEQEAEGLLAQQTEAQNAAQAAQASGSHSAGGGIFGALGIVAKAVPFIGGLF